MAQMNVSKKQEQTHRHTEQTCGLQRESAEGEGWTESLGLVDASCYI